jgi:lysophospholipase L1-like esterase
VSFNAAHAEDGDLDNHYPFPPDEEGLYEDLEMPRPRLDGGDAYESQPRFLKDSLNRRRYAWRWDTPEKYDRNMRNYLRMLTGLDRNVGRILTELERLGLADSTVVIFLGDNGYYMGERGFAGKWSHYDESLHVPLVIKDPRARHVAVASELVLNLDIAPTILDLAGIEPDPGAQGRSLLPLVRNESPEGWREGFFCEHLMRHDAIPRWQGYRSSRYKYAFYFDDSGRAEFLHDLVADPDELVNLAPSREHREVLRSMRARTKRLADGYARAGDPLPRVLLLGDSISIGYHRYVEAELIGEAIVVRPAENCAGTTKGVTKIDEWLALDGGEFDVIHFNFGLHDLKRVRPDGSNSNDPSDPRQAGPEAYERNLRRIVQSLEDSGAELIFATTTPYPSGVRPHRSPDDAHRYNQIARTVMQEHGIRINDLFAEVETSLDRLQQPVNVHFSETGSRALAEAVVASLRSALKMRGG